MLTMNPATGQMEDDYGKEPAGGMVSQQDQAAATSPTFIGNGLPAVPAVPPPVAPSEPALGPNDVMPMSPDSVPPPVGAGDLPSPILDAGPSGPGAGEPTGSGTMPVVQIPDGGIEPISASGPGPNEVIPMSPDEGAPPITGAPGTEPPKPGEIEKPKALIDERIEAAKREGEVKAEIAKIEAEKAQVDLDQKIAAKKEEDDLIARSEQRVAEGRARREAEYTKYRDMTVQDAWGDHGTAKRIMAALAMILGGRNGMAVAIGAAQGLEEKKKTELALQEKVMASAGKSLEEIKDQTAEEMADFKTRQAAAFGVTAARLEQEKRAQGIPEAKIAADQDVLKLRAEEEKAKREAAKLAIDTENERLKMDLTKAQTRQANSAADKNDRYVQKGGKGAGGGHGGAGLAAGAQKVADAITNGVENDDGTRRELTPKEKMAVATANGIKLNGKSSETTLDSINKMVAFDAKTGQAGKKTDLAGERQVSKEAKEWAQTNGINKIAAQQRELSGLQKELADNPHNPLLQALAVEKAVSAARGGAASKQALALALGHLGGSLDTADAVISKIRSGEIGEKQLENFSGFIRGQLGNAQKEGKDAYDNFNKFINTQPPERRKVLEGERGRLFSGFHGFQGSGEAKEHEKPKSNSERARAIVSDPANQARLGLSDQKWKVLQAAASMSN